ncbi:hypothetical protein Q1695_009530 [Nippostrongylus brasiliensis]|nr:hypothetical protein Q1695_009530 [Nippostrongylus brasiliensis]
MVVQLESSTITLRADQAQPVRMGDTDVPLLAIQAAFGTGKTVVGALIAARLATNSPDTLVIAMAVTNGAVAQFTDTLLRLAEFRHLNVLRFVADTALMEGCPRTSVDLHTILTQLAETYKDKLSEEDLGRCRAYASGRQLLETAMFHPELTIQLSDDEREQFRIAERENSEATEDAVAIMYEVRRPDVLCITASSLLNASGSLGLFGPYLDKTNQKSVAVVLPLVSDAPL